MSDDDEHAPQPSAERAQRHEHDRRALQAARAQLKREADYHAAQVRLRERELRRLERRLGR